jgi:hypothetical protein
MNDKDKNEIQQMITDASNRLDRDLTLKLASERSTDANNGEVYEAPVEDSAMQVLDYKPLPNKPFDVRLYNIPVATVNTYHVLIYLPSGLNSWTRGISIASAFDSGTTVFSADGSTGWYDTGSTLTDGAGAIDIYAWINTSSSMDITNSPSEFTVDTTGDSSGDARTLGLQKHVASIDGSQHVIQLFEGNMEEIGLKPL